MNRYYLRQSILLLSALFVGLGAAYGVERPNVVWIMAEDVTKDCFSLYNSGEFGAETPNLERLAQSGVIFDNAFCNAPVCSAARSTLITGCYGSRVGTSLHRKLKTVDLESHIDLSPSYLREVGYYTANSKKTDYNCVMGDSVWDEVKSGKFGWRDRPSKEMPFFFVRTLTKCHESCLHFPEQDIDSVPTRYSPDSVRLNKNHPDTKAFRYTYARLYDRIADVDREVGEILDALESDGLLESTIVFYFGDNGGSLPGSKGYTYETGLQVPLVVSVPERWKHLMPIELGKRSQGFVSFVDFAPTLLNIAGVKAPREMDGSPFMGERVKVKELESRDVTFGYGDRFDELYSFTRTIRVGNFKYIRNFNPHQPNSQHAFYRYKMVAFREWRDLFKAGELSDIQSRFFKAKQPEELYDISIDPNESVNLADSPSYSGELVELRGRLNRHIKSQPDLGLIPEAYLIKDSIVDPIELGIVYKKRISRYLDISNLMLSTLERSSDNLIEILNSDDTIAQFWGVTSAIYLLRESSSTSLEGELIDKVKELTLSKSGYLSARAALCLATVGEGQSVSRVLIEALAKSNSGAESLYILNEITYIKEQFPDIVINVEPSMVKGSLFGLDKRLEYFTNL